MATFNDNVVAHHDLTYQTYALLTSVCKFSPTADIWVTGEIYAIKTELSDDGNIGIQTTYTVKYADEDDEDLSHEEVAERIGIRPRVHLCHEEVAQKIRRCEEEEEEEEEDNHQRGKAQPDA